MSVHKLFSNGKLCEIESPVKLPRNPGITFDLERPAEAQMILKPGEVKPRVLRGTFTFNQNAANGVTAIYLICEIVGARGYDLKSQQPIGILVIRDGTIAEDHFLPLPVRLQ